MPFQDPVWNTTSFINQGGGVNAIIDLIRQMAIAAGWTVDKFDTAYPGSDERGRHELYIHSNPANLSEQVYISMKGFNGTGDHQVLCVWMNTGFDTNRRVDNQPGMYARSQRMPTNATDVTQVFANEWDQTGPRRNPAKPSEYLTQDYDGLYGGPVPIASNSLTFLNTFATTQHDEVWLFWDLPLSGSSKSLTAVWYVDDVMQCISFGHVLYDNEGTAPDDVDGHFLTKWVSRRSESVGTQPPINNSLGGTVTNPGDGPLAIIRNRTNGSVTWPPGTATGVPLLQNVGPVTKNSDKLGASDNLNDPNISEIVRPDVAFDSWENLVQGNAFPNPRLGVHREFFGGQDRVGVALPRAISLWPDGGPMVGTGPYASGGGAANWSDSHFRFPWWYIATTSQREGDIISEGLRQYQVFPGNRNGINFDLPHRAAGLAFRIA